MRRTEAHQGVRMIKFLDILSRYEATEFGQLEAAALLGIGSGRSVAGASGTRRTARLAFWDRRLGRVSSKRVPKAREAEVEALYRSRYSGFTAKHFHEHLVKDHGFSWGYNLDQDVLARERAARESQEARRASAQAASPPASRNDAAPGTGPATSGSAASRPWT